MNKLFLIDLSSLVVQYAFGVKKGRPDKDNKIPFIHTRNGAVAFIRRNLDAAGYRFGDEVLVAREGMTTWRHKYISVYKENRDHDSQMWKQIHSVIDAIPPILENQFGWKCMSVFDAEADDIIGSIAIDLNGTRDMTIISSDKDFKQLMHYVDNLTIYSPLKKEFVSKDDAYTIWEHIMRGDKIDNIGSILSYGSEGMIVNGKRRKMLTEEIIKLLFNEQGEFIGTEYPDVVKAYERNRTLIDFRYIPDDVKNPIVKRYHTKEETIEQTFF